MTSATKPVNAHSAGEELMRGSVKSVLCWHLIHIMHSNQTFLWFEQFLSALMKKVKKNKNPNQD